MIGQWVLIEPPKRQLNKCRKSGHDFRYGIMLKPRMVVRGCTCGLMQQAPIYPPSTKGDRVPCVVTPLAPYLLLKAGMQPTSMTYT